MNKKKPGKVFLIPSYLAPETQDRILTEQVKAVIKETTHFFVENVRTARRFISSLRLGVVIDELTFTELDRKTKIADIKNDLNTVLNGKDIGIISEAGMPAIADPGHVLVSWAHKKNIQVIPLVGASSIILALIASGFNGQNFAFSGYLPIKPAERNTEIERLEKINRQTHQTQIFMETPYRNNHLVESILKVCGDHTSLCIASNITSPDEFIKTKTVKEWKTQVPDIHKIPTIFLIHAL